MSKITKITKAPAPHWVGDGFPVRSMLPPAGAMDPFLLLDYAGPWEVPPGAPRGVDEHPHRGFETVTIVYSGEVEHRDSAGNSGHIGPGDVQWMTAASGVVHEEKHGKEFAKKGGVLEMVQLWVNLPASVKMTPPQYQAILNSDIPFVEAEGSTVRVIAGEFGRLRGPAKTSSPIHVWDVRLKAGAKLSLPIETGFSTAIVVLHGEIISAGSDIISAPSLIELDRLGGSIQLDTKADTTLLCLSGQPLREPIVMHGPFVMNTQEEIGHAISDYRSGKMGKLS